MKGNLGEAWFSTQPYQEVVLVTTSPSVLPQLPLALQQSLAKAPGKKTESRKHPLPQEVNLTPWSSELLTWNHSLDSEPLPVA